MAKQNASQDRNFDDLAGRFKKNIYGGLKGAVRLAVLQRDFRNTSPMSLQQKRPCAYWMPVVARGNFL